SGPPGSPPTGPRPPGSTSATCSAPSSVDPVALAARGESVWHRLALGAFGIGWLDDGTVAWRMAPSSPVFLGAVSLRAGVPAGRLAGAVERLAGAVAVRHTTRAPGPRALW